MAGEKGHDLAGRDAGGLGPFAGPKMARDHEGTEGVAPAADFRAPRSCHFTHQQLWLGITRSRYAFGFANLGPRLGHGGDGAMLRRGIARASAHPSRAPRFFEVARALAHARLLEF